VYYLDVAARYGLVVVAQLLRSLVSLHLFKQRVEDVAEEV
jgi:hypothetical protein